MSERTIGVVKIFPAQAVGAVPAKTGPMQRANLSPANSSTLPLMSIALASLNGAGQSVMQPSGHVSAEPKQLAPTLLTSILKGPPTAVRKLEPTEGDTARDHVSDSAVRHQEGKTHSYRGVRQRPWGERGQRSSSI